MSTRPRLLLISSNPTCFYVPHLRVPKLYKRLKRQNVKSSDMSHFFLGQLTEPETLQGEVQIQKVQGFGGEPPPHQEAGKPHDYRELRR